jgi:N-succinyldiaminopimelate aminotransferase
MRDEPLVARMRGFGETIFAEMTALANSLDAINLGQGFPDTDGPDAMLERAVAELRAGANQYPPGPGRADLREAVARQRSRRYGLDYDPATEVFVTVGATEAVSATILALCEPGDEVVVLEPYYDSYAASVALAGAVRVPVPLRPGSATGRFALDVAELSAAVTSRTRLVLLNSPHNPTGTVLRREELDAVARLCVDRDLVVVTDEVYEHLVYDGGEHVPIATLPGMRDRTVSISSAGKTFSVTGWKIGWVCAPQPFIRAISTVKQFTTFTHSGPMQAAVAYALDHEMAWVDAQCSSLQSRRDRLVGGLREVGLDVHPPEATYFVLADVRPLGIDDAETAARELAHKAGVVGIPCGVFCDHLDIGRPYLRFAFCKRDGVLDDAVARLRNRS